MDMQRNRGCAGLLLADLDTDLHCQPSEWVGISQTVVGRQSVAGTFLVHVGTGIPEACRVLVKKLLVCNFPFMSFVMLVYFILVLIWVKFIFVVSN